MPMASSAAPRGGGLRMNVVGAATVVKDLADRYGQYQPGAPRAPSRPALRGCGLIRKAFALCGCLWLAMPAGAVSISFASDAQQGARVHEAAPIRPVDLRQVRAGVGLDLDSALARSVDARSAAGLRGSVHRPDADDAFSHDDTQDDLPGIELTSLALSEAPLLDSGQHRTSGTSVAELLRSVVTVSGERVPQPESTPSGSRRAGGDSLLGFLQPLAVELLESGLSDRRLIDGITVFSILGRGSFVFEVARDGSGLVLSELSTGRGMVFGRDPARRTPADAAPWQSEQAAPVPAQWLAQSSEESTVRLAMDALFGLVHGLVRALVWAATNPVVLALAVPVLLLGLLIGATRRGAVPEVLAHTAQPADEAERPRAAVRRRRGRRRRARRRGTWGMLLAQLRESFGFPDAGSLRETDFAAPRAQPQRSAPKSA